jgi:hypothetical protein
MTLSSVDMAEAHALTLRKGSDLAFSLQLSSVFMYENRFISGLESLYFVRAYYTRSVAIHTPKQTLTQGRRTSLKKLHMR